MKSRCAYDTFTAHGGGDREWMKDAVCRNIDLKIVDALFFPEFADGPDGRNQRKRAVEQARKICWGTCTVAIQCLTYALTTDCRFGIWGGMPEERRPHGGKA